MLARLCAVGVLLGSLGAGRGTVDGLADQLAERARPALGGARDLDVLVAVSAPWPKLAADVSELLAARLRAGGLRSVSTAGLPANARAAGYERVVRLDLQLAGGRVRASGTVQVIGGALWDEPAETRAHLYAEVVLDDELRAYGLSPSAPPSGFAVRNLSLGDVPLLALAIGDTEGDGRPLLVGATASEVIGWRIEAGRAVERFRVRFAGRPAAQRPRSEVAMVSVEPGLLYARASGFADGVVRARAGQRVLRGFRLPGLEQTCELAPGVDWFTGESCGAAAELPDKFWSAAGLRRGTAAPSAIAAVVPAAGGTGTLWVRGAGAPRLAPVRGDAVSAARGLGAQVAVATLARGEVVATSEGSASGEPDAIVIRALTAEAPVLHRVERLASVRALAGGDLDGDGREEIVAAVRDDAAQKTDLWIIE